MDNLDDSENNAKVSDSAYSNSCSNSQSRRSHSSKSTHSGSHSSGSSGYGGKPSTSGSSNNLNQPTEKRSKEKETKKKKLQTSVEDHIKTECMPPEPVPVFEIPKEEPNDVVTSASPTHVQTENALESMEIATVERISVKDEIETSVALNTALHVMSTRSTSSLCSDGFSCVISMHDGVVMYTTSSLTSTLGFPKDMWIGRSFIDFVHPKDRNTFASQITNGLAVPKHVNGTQEKVQSPGNSISTMFCRIRRYRGLAVGFGVKDKVVTFMPFLLKLTFKNICDEEGKLIYLVLQATSLFSAFKIPNEVVLRSVPFVMRHVASGNLEYIDPESVPYLGYLPQDVTNKDALQLYHPDDLVYLKQVYETIVKEGSVPRCKPYRMMAQNGDYVKLETVWSSFINPWSKKLEFVIGKHYIIEGPVNPDVFQSTEPIKMGKNFEEGKKKAQSLRDSIVRIMNEVLTKPAEVAKQQMSKRCQDLASFMESLMEEQPKIDDELRLEIHEHDNSYYERDSVMLGGISPHHDCSDSKTSTETPLSYNQLNYNDNLQRYFDSHQPFSYEDYKTVTGENILNLKNPNAISNSCFSPMAQNSGDSGEMTSSCESSGVAVISSPHVSFDDYHPVRLTEILLVKHNADMEKNLVKKHRETRSSSKSDREKASNENRLKQKEHLARCNASFQTTVSSAEPQSQGVKRTSKQLETESLSHKHHCSSSRQTRRKQATSAAPAQPSTTITTTVATQWSTPVNNLNTFLPRIAMTQQMPIMSPVAAVPGMFPMYYVPTATASGSALPMPTTGRIGQDNSNNNHSGTGQYQNSAGMFQTYYVPTPAAPTVSTTAERIGQDNTNNTYSNANQYQSSPGMFPTYYVPTTTGPVVSTSERNNINNNYNNTGQYQNSAGMFPTYYVPTTTGPVISTSERNGRDNINNYNNTAQYQNTAGMFPTYYVPTTSGPVISTSERNGRDNINNNYNNTGQYQNSAVQYMMYGQTVIGSPIVYTPINTPVSYTMIPQVIPTNTVSPLGLTTSNYEEACKPSLLLKPSKSHGGSIWRDKKRAGSEGTSSKAEQDSGVNDNVCSSSNALNRSTEAVTDNKVKSLKVGNSEEPMDRTDGESSYSSFYSSFFKTESGSAEDSGDAKKVENKDNKNRFWNKAQNKEMINAEECNESNKLARRKAEPPWMEQVSLTSELIYKYQVPTKSIDEVLLADKQKMNNFEQPSLVNEQLGQLYLDLQLEGVAARLTLEEGITSSGSSGEETTPDVTKRPRKKRDYNKLMMIYEEDAPFPSPEGIEEEESLNQNLNLS